MVPIRNRSLALGTCRLAQSSFLAFFANNVRTAGPIGMGEALIDVFRSSIVKNQRGTDRCVAKAPLSCNKFHYLNYKHAYITILAPRQCLAMLVSST